MSGKFLPTLVFLSILAVGILFVFSVLNPAENSRIISDQATINLLMSSKNATAAASHRCFKPASQYYQGDPRSIYDAAGEMNFAGYLCVGR